MTEELKEEHRKIKSFTKVGDRGMTVIGYEEDGITPLPTVRKNSPLIELTGEIDELSAVLGLCEGRIFRGYQKLLSDIMGMIYLGKIDAPLIKGKIIKMEKFCLKHEDDLPDKFEILTGQINMARTICRRVERRLWTVLESGMGKVEGMNTLGAFFNRFSSWLYVNIMAEVDIDEI